MVKPTCTHPRGGPPPRRAEEELRVLAEAPVAVAVDDHALEQLEAHRVDARAPEHGGGAREAPRACGEVARGDPRTPERPTGQRGGALLDLRRHAGQVRLARVQSLAELARVRLELRDAPVQRQERRRLRRARAPLQVEDAAGVARLRALPGLEQRVERLLDRLQRDGVGRRPRRERLRQRAGIRGVARRQDEVAVDRGRDVATGERHVERLVHPRPHLQQLGRRRHEEVRAHELGPQRQVARADDADLPAEVADLRDRRGEIGEPARGVLGEPQEVLPVELAEVVAEVLVLPRDVGRVERRGDHDRAGGDAQRLRDQQRPARRRHVLQDVERDHRVHGAVAERARGAVAAHEAPRVPRVVGLAHVDGDDAVGGQEALEVAVEVGAHLEDAQRAAVDAERLHGARRERVALVAVEREAGDGCRHASTSQRCSRWTMPSLKYAVWTEKRPASTR
jgi:hypothetical protein